MSAMTKRKLQVDLDETMQGIRTTALKIPKVKSWAKENNRGNKQIVQKTIQYLERIGEFITNQDVEGISQASMWDWAAGKAGYNQGGAAMEKIYIQVRKEQEAFEV
mmetsp:Transcript_9967/g.18912  ORF Transcript_9967/g.18912 Transcript_9967/m.18912 type:complete len:106 (-) Transcript_9967:2099-2416(-)